MSVVVTHKPIFSLFAVRNELGRSTKGQIYVSKIAIGAVVAFILYLLSFGNSDVVFLGSAAVFFTSKICYFVNTGDWPHGLKDWDVVPDWVCDCMLHFGWLFAMHVLYQEWKSVAFMFVLWAMSYPWSSE